MPVPMVWRRRAASRPIGRWGFGEFSTERRKVEFESGQYFRADFSFRRGAGKQLVAARLKRKKLTLRDEIVKIEARILPDIIA